MLNLRRSDIRTPRASRPETPLFAHLPLHFVGGIFAPQCSWLTRMNHIRTEVPKPHLEGWVTTLTRQNVRTKLSTHHAHPRRPAIFQQPAASTRAHMLHLLHLLHLLHTWQEPFKSRFSVLQLLIAIARLLLHFASFAAGIQARVFFGTCGAIACGACGPSPISLERLIGHSERRRLALVASAAARSRLNGRCVAGAHSTAL